MPKVDGREFSGPRLTLGPPAFNVDLCLTHFSQNILAGPLEGTDTGDQSETAGAKKFDSRDWICMFP